MTFIKWLLLLVMITRTESKSILIRRDYSIGEGMMKTILESCYTENSFPNPVVIFGKFSQLIEGVSIIRINNFLNAKDYEQHGSLQFKASSVVLMEEPPDKLFSNLKLLRRMKLWNNMVPFFIIGHNTSPCTNSRIILSVMWSMEILNSIYICPNIINNTPEIYTFNPMTNYAPYPWKRINELNELNIFRQNFDANISCAHLSYDKTKILNGHNIVAGAWNQGTANTVARKNYFKASALCNSIACKAMRAIIIVSNATGNIEIERYEALKKRYLEGSVDIIMDHYTHDSYPAHPYLFPLFEDELIAIVKLRPEVSTLEKIRHLWSTPVMIAAAFALAILFLILMIKRWSFGSAILDLTRLLTYTSIQTDHRHQSFRIYFTTMLIFMVISNGVFQGKIAAFLTTREKGSPAKSINELVKLGYKMYTMQWLINYTQSTSCPRCKFKGVLTWDECIELVLNGTKNVCIIGKAEYEFKYILLPLDRVKESLDLRFTSFKCRHDWPLRDRFNGMMMRIVEAGLPDYWKMQLTRIPKAKRQSMEAEWSSAQYRPVALVKLDFAFKLLAAGLSLATIVFFLELCWARYVNP